MDERLARLYAEVPEIACAGKCASECTTVPCGPGELARLEAHSQPPVRAGFCRYLNEGRCTAHEVRPMLCRLYGVWERLPCRFGCQPERMLSDAEGRQLLNRAMEI